MKGDGRTIWIYYWRLSTVTTNLCGVVTSVELMDLPATVLFSMLLNAAVEAETLNIPPPEPLPVDDRPVPYY